MLNASTKKAIQTTYEKLKTFDSTVILDRFKLENKIDSSEQANFTLDEFWKFLALAAHSDKPLAMTSKTVDELWHASIMFTRKYQEICSNYLGRFLHHAPNTEAEPVTLSDVENFEKSYLENFGAIPDIWELQRAKLCGGYGCAGGCNCK